MPRDSKGNFHLNRQRALAADSAGDGKPPRPPSHTGAGAGAEHEPQGYASEGHEHIHNALREAHAKSGGGKHLHALKAPGGGFQTHHTDETGEPQGPHDHENIDQLKDALSQYFDEESNENYPPPPSGRGTIGA